MAALGASEALVIELSDRRWEHFISGREDRLGFHTQAWARLLAECYGYHTFALAVTDKTGRICAGVPLADVRDLLGRRRWISLPFTDVLPPLLAADADALVVTQALECVRREANVAVEVRAHLAGSVVHRRSDAVLHMLPVGADHEAVFRTLHRSVQRGIHRAERENVQVTRAESETDLTRTFYRLHAATRRRLGVPVQPRRFFELLWRLVLEPGVGFLLLAHAGARPVAGAVFLRGSRCLTYKYGASDASAWPLRPNHAVTWSAIEYACANGYTQFDFGRTDNRDTGLREFKFKWGAQESRLVYSFLSDRPPKSHALPATAARPILRHSPVWLCRAAGALLYRYAA